MKTCYFVIIIPLLLLSCKQTKTTENVSQNKNDLNRENILGKVKSIKEIGFDAVVLSESFGSNSAQSNCSKITYFNEKGNMLEQHDFDSIGKLYSKTVWSYDEKQNLIEEGYYSPNGKLRHHKTWEYDGKGNPITINIYNMDGKLFSKKLWKYDDGGNPIELIQYELNRDIVIATQKYDINGNEVEIIIFDAEGGVGLKTTYKRDSYGRNIETNQCFYYDEEICNKVVRKYNENGNLIEISSYPNGVLSDKSSFKYRLDKQGNWIEKITISKGIEDQIIKREIEYY